MKVKYKGCFTSKRNHNFDQVETSRYMSRGYLHLLRDSRSFLENNRITKFKHRVFYYMHEDSNKQAVLRKKSEGYSSYNYRYMTKAKNDDHEWSLLKFEMQTKYRDGWKRDVSSNDGTSHISYNERDGNECVCNLCHNVKAKRVVKFFDDLDQADARSHNCYVTKDNLIKFISNKKVFRNYFAHTLENESMYLKHGEFSRALANRTWNTIFQRTKASFNVIPLNNPNDNKPNSHLINGFGLGDDPIPSKGYYDPTILSISPTFFYKVYMKGFARSDTVISENKVFIADVKLLKQDTDISANPKIKLYRAMGYNAKREKVDGKRWYTIATYQHEDAQGEIDMNDKNKYQPSFTPPQVHISGVEKRYEDMNLSEKRRLGRMIEQKIAKGNLSILNAI